MDKDLMEELGLMATDTERLIKKGRKYNECKNDDSL